MVLAEKARQGFGAFRRPSSRAVMATGAVNAITAFAGSIGGIILARGLGPSARGHLVTILQWPTVLAVLGSLGITTATCYLISRDRTLGAAITASATWCALITGAVVAVIGSVFLAPVIARTAEVRLGLILAFLTAPAFISAGVFVGALQARDIRKWNIARSVQPGAYLAFIAALWVVGRLSLTAAVGAYACSIVLQFILSGALAYKTLGRLAGGRLVHVRALYAYGPKVTMSALPQIVNVQVDMLVLSVLPTITAARLGNYAVAVSMATLTLPIAIASGSVAFPLVAGTMSEATRRRVERKSIRFAAIAAGVASVSLSIVAPVAAPVVFGAGFGSAVPCLWLLAPGITCLAVSRVVSDILRGRGRPLLVMAAEGAGVAVTIIGLIILVPIFSIFGAAATSSITYAMVLLVLLRGLRSARMTNESSNG